MTAIGIFLTPQTFSTFDSEQKMFCVREKFYFFEESGLCLVNGSYFSVKFEHLKFLSQKLEQKKL